MTEPVDISDMQAGSVAFLETESSLVPGERARRIDTHAARIFLAGDRAFKLKRAVRLGYLDFSTLARRKAALETELLLNRRTAPDLYLRVRPLCRTKDGAFNLAGQGEVIDWLLEMRRFPDDALLERLVEEGRLTQDLVFRLADQIRAFHHVAKPSSDTQGHARIAAVITGNEASIARYPHVLPPRDAHKLVARQKEIATRLADLLNERATKGRVRHCHGDLHLANIAVIDGAPLLFDCLEFDEELATTDVLYDLAFLLMDLWSRRLRLEANIVFNRYLDIAEDDEAGIALLPLFMSIRATIRAHALAAQVDDRDRSSTLASRARGYLEIAEAFLAPSDGRLIAIGGLSGTGKSTVARMIGHEVGSPPGARIIRSDVLRKRLAGVRPEAPLSREAYNEEASARVYGELERLAGDALDAGYAVIADAVFAREAERTSIGRLAARRGTTFDGIWLEASPSQLERRVETRRGDASDADVTVVRQQASYAIGELDGWLRVDAGGQRAASAANVRNALGLS
ncbi:MULTISPECIES: AAA family ATPase [Sphingobium]|uniref:AAA family ATPase n=2 Tax=Sphingobium TaxID=165695 RepID=A0A9X7YFM3_SPHYA|nr:bifunctional aminoglycoside phosphotransferase/ATP-binding protein [Sphingobium yanoikuyae]QNG48744.1 AAA family ATPase [Sphingobium yanoikuyae]